jgi:hypothetical protein
MFEPVVAEGFNYVIKSSFFGFPRNDYPGIFHGFGVLQNVVIEIRYGFNLKGFIVVICIYSRSCGNDKVVHNGICLLRIATIHYSKENGQTYQALFHNIWNELTNLLKLIILINLS